MNSSFAAEGNDVRMLRRHVEVDYIWSTPCLGHAYIANNLNTLAAATTEQDSDASMRWQRARMWNAEFSRRLTNTHLEMTHHQV